MGLTSRDGAAGAERERRHERGRGRDHHGRDHGRHPHPRQHRPHGAKGRLHHHLHHHHHLPGHRRHPPLLFAVAALISLAVIVPLIFLIVQALDVGWSALRPLVFRGLTGQLLWNSVSLTVVVTALCAVLGTVVAWVVERTDLPGRRVWSVLVVIPLGIPDFVTSFGWKAIFPSIGGFWAAVMVMTFAVYPLVYLPVAANLRQTDPAQEEVARSLGLGRLRTFWVVTLGQAKLAILGGSVLVALVVLAEFGAFEILGFHTLTTEIYTEINVGFDLPAACALSLSLVALGAGRLTGEGAARGRGRANRIGAGASRQPRPRPLGKARIPALGGVVGLSVVALGVPVGAIIYLMVRGSASTLPAASLGGAAATTFGYAAAAGLVATLAAVPIALLSVRFPGHRVQLLERTNMLVLAVPGIVVALSATYVTDNLLRGTWYQTPQLLVLAYAVMFFPMAVVSVRASVARSPLGLEEVGHSLGVSRRAVFWRVTLPLIGPGLVAAFCLVFLESATELTATLVLHPTGVQTLATQFWSYQTDLSYSQAAPYAGVMVLLAAVPSYVLGRWFARMPGSGGGGATAAEVLPPATMVR